MIWTNSKNQVHKQENGPVGNLRTESNRYMPGLDGMRALAVLAVVAYHFNLPWASGGLLGVCMFFVLSGYLITDLLDAQWNRFGRINLKNFWQRRIRRLLPALLVMLAGVVLWTAIVDPLKLSSLKEDVLAAMFYASNWWLIFHHVSYFASFGPPSPLNHLWSLAVEEQFYLFWPLLLWLGLRYLPSRKRLVGLILAGAMISALAMAVIYQPGTDPSRVYYGTDTRAFALLIGAALALMMPSRKLSDIITRRTRNFLDIAGGAALLIVLLMIWQTNQYETFLYRGGLFIFSLASAVLVAVLAHPASRFGRLFGWKPLRWLGVRSYSLYLWHYPVIVLTSPAVNTNGVNVLRILGQLGASIALAALSYRYIEEPFRRGSWKKLWQRISNRKEPNYISIGGWVSSFGTYLILGLSCLAIAVVVILSRKYSNLLPSVKAISSGVSVQSIVKKEPEPVSTDGLSGSAGSQNSSGPVGLGKEKQTSTSKAATDVKANVPEQEKGSSVNSSAALKEESGHEITVIGDSVMLGAEPALKKLLPGIEVNAQVGRQLYQATALVKELKAQGKLGDKVVIELGTNGPFTQKQLTELLDSLGPVKQIILINTRVPRTWEEVVNQTLAQVAAVYPHTKLVNWYSASQGHDAYFYQDGVHLNPTGMQAYASLIANALNS